MTSREIGFGLYDVRRPATSPTRKGAAKGRPQPRAAPQKAAPCAAPPALPPVTASTHARALHGAAGRGGVASLKAAGRANSAPPLEAAATASPLVGPSTALVAQGAPSCGSTFLENHLRCVVHLTHPTTLPAHLHAVLQNVLRRLQQDRAQQKGQQPCRRRSSLAGDAGAEAEVAACLAHAAQAPSLAAAAEMLERFLLEQDTAATTRLSSSRQGVQTAATCSPVVLVGTALAELVFGDHIPSSTLTDAQLLAYLDRAVSVGHPAAMVCVGLCLRDGRGGLARDVDAGLTWLRCAAAAGYLPAMHEVGESYERGLLPLHNNDDGLRSSSQGESGVDWGEAMRWYRQAAEANYAPSQLNLGKLLLTAAEQGVQDGSADAAAVDHLRAEAKRWVQACATAGVEEGVRLLKLLK